MQKKMTRARIRAAPTSEPTTIPAIAPPDRPDPVLPVPPVTGAEVPVGATEEDDGNRGAMEVVVGRWTPTHLGSTFEFRQQELVSFKVLVLQNEHKPCKLDWKPHSAFSLTDASMQLPLRARSGLEQMSKSDLIMPMALGPATPHSSGLEAISCSLIAYCAQESAHRGREFSLGVPHPAAEAWTMELQSTDVVYRA